MQERLLFFPQQLDERIGLALPNAYPRAQNMELVANDGVRLRGWLIAGPKDRSWPLVLYYGGNAEEVSWLVPEFSRIPDWGALLVNYRGYGLSEGAPSEAALYGDALALYDHITSRRDIDVARVIVMGRSLGTGVATFVASQRPVAGVVLISPYDSLVHVAHEVYPFLPVNLLLRHRFESVARAPSIHVPLLALVATADTVVRPERSRQLVQAWGGPARLELLQGVDHNTVQSHPDYWKRIDAFLGERAASTQRLSAP